MIFGSRHAKRTDAELMALVAKGDEKAFEELLKRYQGVVYNFAMYMLKDPSEAEDIAQETFLRLYKTSAAYRQKASLKTFLLRIAKNLCIDHFRKKKPDLLNELPEIPTEATPLSQLEAAVSADMLEKAIDDLPVNQRTAVLLRHMEQLSYNQIAEVMEVSLGAVESLLVRARRTLRAAVSEAA
ncbi:RNA polymerase sigma-70 factor, ECF subfamily [Desulfatibacillum alkenivorans DSM 16219]|jgi:RNA polymerase sigma-70 factor (ECF subfamily)|uniref:RNA polymerase sigma-70 factor, ECF subfamily n=1 Tax=Desulfatibacillum alkenivorans DSM 16219 TaxID=1121393 RepID=A0A1M6TQS8_9BACT|nr:sigma-70 family RNA polymerase sigma factor [Desulfatibacillum alkenivorans]SHK59263.1 RNA polymerase sigma-70 factor, ECF subfamily [Desulfatibacillum alkenivorans DSM 16219]